jgi:hypothetical protein
VLALEIFRFLAARAFDRVRMSMRRLSSFLLAQRRVLVVGSGP